MRDPKKTEGLNEYEAEFLRGIDERHWAVTRVGPGPKDPQDAPRYAYTTGLYLRFRHPEILIYGLPFDSMLEVLNTIGNQAKAGKTYNVGIPYKDIFEGRRCQFKPVDRAYYRERLAASNWFYQSDKYPTLQLFWPDNAGLFPWERGCEDIVADAQPLLFRGVTTDQP
jgi:hypothetical protein